MSSVATQQARAWYVQRISAMVLALCVIVHIGIIMYAVRGGLSGNEILERTRGSLALGLFYSVFVLACAAHVPVGLANIAQEWLGWGAGPSRALSLLAGLLILLMGWCAVYGVTLS